MKALIKIFVLTIGCIGWLNAQTNYVADSYEMSVAGTSTLHDWESSVNEVTIESKFLFDNNTLTGIEKLSVSVPAKGITSTKGSIMDNKTWKALKAEEHPNITYKMNKVSKIEKTDAGLILNLSGAVNIAGVEKIIDMKVTGKALGGGKMEFEGSKLLNMKDFDMEPPTALFGQIKTGEEITVKFKVTMSPEKSK